MSIWRSDVRIERVENVVVATRRMLHPWRTADGKVYAEVGVKWVDCDGTDAAFADEAQRLFDAALEKMEPAPSEVLPNPQPILDVRL